MKIDEMVEHREEKETIEKVRYPVPFILIAILAAIIQSAVVCFFEDHVRTVLSFIIMFVTVGLLIHNLRRWSIIETWLGEYADSLSDSLPEPLCGDKETHYSLNSDWAGFCSHCAAIETARKKEEEENRLAKKIAEQVVMLEENQSLSKDKG